MSLSLSDPILHLIFGVIAVSLWPVIQAAWRSYRSQLRTLVGPRSSSRIFGNLKDYADSSDYLVTKRVAEFGGTFVDASLLSAPRLITTDLRALAHVLNHNSVYEKQYFSRFLLARLLGDGLIVAEGEKHKQQRRIMNPSFGPAQMREIMDVIWLKSDALRTCLEKEPSQTSINIVPWLNKATLDVIGLAGFNYDFDSFGSSKNDLRDAFDIAFRGEGRNRAFLLLSAYIPPLRLIRSDANRRVRKAKDTMLRIGAKLLADKKAAILGENCGVTVEKGQVKGRDLLTALVRANMASDLREEERMPDEDVLAQVPTFLVAGHETTSTATAWALHALTCDPFIQSTLRSELLSIADDSPSMETLQSLPYLDAFVRETLRYFSVVPAISRVAVKDDVLPFEKEITDKYGRKVSSLRISKGDIIFVPIHAVNHSRELYGVDADTFDPSRWTRSPQPASASHIPGIWGHSLAFSGGARACIGYRFAVLELKALLFTLVRGFEWERQSAVEVVCKPGAGIVTRPLVMGELEKGPQLKVGIRPLRE